MATSIKGAETKSRIKRCINLDNDSINNIIIKNEEDQNDKQNFIDGLYDRLINGKKISDGNVYHMPGGNITRDTWSIIKENTSIKKTITYENADYIAVGIKTFRKMFQSSSWYQACNSKEFSDNIERCIESDYILNINHFAGDTNVLKVITNNKQLLITELQRIQIKATTADYCVTGRVSYHGHRFYNRWGSSELNINDVIRYATEAIVRVAQDETKDKHNDYVTLNNTYIKDFHHLLDNLDIVVSERAIIDNIKDHLVVLDLDMYKSITAMLKSPSESNMVLAIDLLSSVSVESSLGYLMLIMYQNMGKFSNHRELFNNSKSRSMLLELNTITAEAMKDEKVWGFDRSQGLPKRLEDPSILLKLLKKTNNNTPDILEIIMEMVSKDFKDFIKNSWIEGVIDSNKLMLSFDFKEEYKQRGGE